MTELLRCGRWTFKGGVWSYWCKCILKFLNHWNSLTFRRTELQTPSSHLFCHAFPPSLSSTCIQHPRGLWNTCVSAVLYQALSPRGIRGFRWGVYEESSDQMGEENRVPDVGQRQSLVMWVTLVGGAFFCFIQLIMWKNGTSVFLPTGLQWKSITPIPLGVKRWLPWSTSAAMLLTWSAKDLWTEMLSPKTVACNRIHVKYGTNLVLTPKLQSQATTVPASSPHMGRTTGESVLSLPLKLSS